MKRICFQLTLVFASLFFWESLSAQSAKRFKEVIGSGTVRDVQRGAILIESREGVSKTYKIQDKDEQGISVGGRPYDIPAKIRVTGTLGIQLLEKGMYVEIGCKINKVGKTNAPIENLKVVVGDTGSLKLDLDAQPENSEFVNCHIVGRVASISRKQNVYKLTLQVPQGKPAKRGHMTLDVSETAQFEISSDNLNRILPGDLVEEFKGLELSSGEVVILNIKLRMAAKREKATTTFHEQLEQKFSHLSDEPVLPRKERSEHFILYTDISDRNAKVLLSKLETMFGLISRYFGKKPYEPIECFVVSNLDRWNGSPEIPLRAAGKIAEGAGVTLSVRIGPNSKSIVYACDNHGVVQHEAVHAYCNQTFGDAGPVWYAEGMAEMGQYWQPDQPEVQIDPVVVDYLTHSPRKNMKDIVTAGQRTDDSWEAYAWRWALCHLLASNPNYARRFKQLGINLMSGGDDSFDNAFGSVANQISFEYDQFISNFDNGYRADLCVWDWSVKASDIPVSARVKAEVAAMAGWQPTKLLIKKGVDYDYIDTGKTSWQIHKEGQQLSADGDPLGNGRLIGATLENRKLSEPFELGKQGRFTAPSSGQLYVRCRDKWTSLGDNDGAITVYFRKSPKGKE